MRRIPSNIHEDKWYYLDPGVRNLSACALAKMDRAEISVKERFRIVIVTHNLGQAIHNSGFTLYFYVQRDKHSQTWPPEGMAQPGSWAVIPSPNRPGLSQRKDRL